VADAGRSTDATPRLLDEFVVLRSLGRGSFGRVKLVENERTGRRYAVKEIMARGPEAVSRFLLEAQHWINLPEHPNIAGCYFVRAVGERIAIFSEFVEGGSLRDAIDDGTLYAGPAPEERVLQAAAGAASGLDQAHAHGLLHLDVKPANVLLAGDAAKVCDFGLAAGVTHSSEVRMQLEQTLDYLVDDPRADPQERELMRELLHQELFTHKPGTEISVPGGGGLTPAYASPEQEDGAPVTAATDVWSWAVTVLEMVVGGRPWRPARDAPDVLEALRSGRQAARIPMPETLADVLGACLQPHPDARPASLGDVADRLTGASRPPAPRRELNLSAGDPRTADPRAWLQLAYEAAGLDPLATAEFWPVRVGTRQGRALENLRALTVARRHLEAVPRSGWLAVQYGLLLTDIAQVRCELHDLAGALHDFEGACAAVRVELGDEARSLEGRVLTEIAVLHRRAGRTRESLAASGQAVTVLRRVAEADPAGLAVALMTDADTDHAGDRIQLYAEAATAAERDGCGELLARIAVHHAAALADTDSSEATAAWTQADDLLAQHAGGSELVPLKALATIIRSRLAAAMPDRLRHAEAAIGLLVPLGDDADVAAMAEAMFLAGEAEEHLDRPQAAMDRFDGSARVLEAAVERDGRADLADAYARSLDHHATLARSLGDARRGLELGQRAVQLWKRLAAIDGAGPWDLRLADARIKLAVHLQANGHPDAAEREIAAAMRLLEEEEL
jgi:serine/threonine protein kinase